MAIDIEKKILREIVDSSGRFHEFLDLELEFFEPGNVKLSAAVREDQRNTIGYLHGGVVFSFLDVAGALASIDDPITETGLTISMNVSFILPAKAKRVVVCARRIGGGRRIRFVNAELTCDDSSEPVARANASFKRKSRGAS